MSRTRRSKTKFDRDVEALQRRLKRCKTDVVDVKLNRSELETLIKCLESIIELGKQ